MKNNILIKKEDVKISNLDTSRDSSTKFAINVISEALAEVSENEKVRMELKLQEVFKEWQYELGIYPPKTTGIMRGLINLGFKEEDSPSVAYKDYISLNEISGIDKKEIKPWDCDHKAKTPVDLFFKLFIEGYLPLLQYINKEDAPRIDSIFAAAIILSLQYNMSAQSINFLEWSYRLVDIRMSVQKTIIGRSMPFVEKEYNRKIAQAEQARIKKELTEQAVREEWIELKRNNDKPSQKEIAARVGISQPQVSKIIKKIQAKGDVLADF